MTCTEYQQSEAIPLSITERDDLQAVLPSLTIVPAAGEDAAYHLTPSSTVGAVEIGDLSVLIRPKIGIPQLLSLACYAMGVFKSQEKRLFDFEEETETLCRTRLPSRLHAAARRAFSRGLLHGYRTEEEALHTVRGRIRFADQIRQRYGIPLPIEVRYDEFTDDIYRKSAREGRSRYTPRRDAPPLSAGSPESGVDCGDARERVIR